MLGWIIQDFPVCPRSPHPVQRWLFSRQPHHAAHEYGDVSEGSSFSRLPSLLFGPTFNIFSFIAYSPHSLATSSLMFPTSPTTCSGFSHLPWVWCCLLFPHGWTLWPSPWPPGASLVYSNTGARGTMTITFMDVQELIGTQKTWWGSMSSAVPKRCRINCPKGAGRGGLPDAGGWRVAQWELKCGNKWHMWSLV